jgi:very-short-patch-repair endonuclease
MTTPEEVLWHNLRARQLKGLKFRRKHPLADTVVDFFCPSARLIVEVTGRGQDRVMLARRDAAFVAAGHGVVRVTRAEVEDDIEGLLSRIATVARARM